MNELEAWELSGDLRCPACNGKLNVASPEYGEKRGPKPNDLSVCSHCQAFLRYAGVLKLVPLTEEEFGSLPELHQRNLLQVRGTQKAFRQRLGGDTNPN